MAKRKESAEKKVAAGPQTYVGVVDMTASGSMYVITGQEDVGDIFVDHHRDGVEQRPEEDFYPQGKKAAQPAVAHIAKPK